MDFILIIFGCNEEKLLKIGEQKLKILQNKSGQAKPVHCCKRHVQF